MRMQFIVRAQAVFSRMWGGSHDRLTNTDLILITYAFATMTQPTIQYGDPVRIAEQLDKTGVVCRLPNAVPEEWLAQARAEVEDRLLNHGVHDHFIRSPQGKEHSAAEAFINSSAVLTLLTDIVRARFQKDRPSWN